MMTEPDKNLQDALLRSHQATEQHNQEQSRLQGMSASDKNLREQQSPELHEKPSYLLKSWDTLRQLDQDLENKAPGQKTKP